MSNYTRDDVDMLRRLFKQHMDMVVRSGNNEAAIRIATRIDDLADRVAQELDSPLTEEP